MSVKYKSNPINITPFVDVLLVLFVILVVIARFDNKDTTKYDQLLKEKEVRIAQLEASLGKKNKDAATPKKPTVSAPVKQEGADQVKELDRLKKENARLTKQLTHESGYGFLDIKIYDEDQISVNGKAISEDALKALIKIANFKFVAKYSDNDSARETYDRFWDYASANGYK